MKVKSMRKSILLVIVLSLTVSGCLVSKKEYLLKEEEAARCTQNLRTQVEENRALKTELSDCQSGLSSARNRVGELTESVSTVSSQKNDLERRLAGQEAVGQELKAQNDKLARLLHLKQPQWPRTEQDLSYGIEVSLVIRVCVEQHDAALR